MDLNSLLRTAVDRGASDVHLKSRPAALLPLDGALRRSTDGSRSAPAQLELILRDVCGSASARLAAFQESGEFDAAYQQAACRGSASTPSGSAATSRSRSG